jgi:hypothetical protein
MNNGEEMAMNPTQELLNAISVESGYSYLLRTRRTIDIKDLKAALLEAARTDQQEQWVVGAKGQLYGTRWKTAMWFQVWIRRHTDPDILFIEFVKGRGKYAAYKKKSIGSDIRRTFTLSRADVIAYLVAERLLGRTQSNTIGVTGVSRI